MDPWTPETRNAFIHDAIHSDKHTGHRGPYSFKTFPKVNGNEAEDVRRSFVTEALAETIYKSNPAYRKLSLSFYETLFHKLSMHHLAGFHMGTNIMLLIKGSNAYAYVTGESMPEEFNFSDLDIIIYINPNLDNATFTELQQACNIVLLQTISQYKRTVDHMLFLNRPIENQLFDAATIDAFKKDFSNNLKNITLPDGAEFISPFESDETRNYCSRNSFLLANSETKTDSVVKVEVPHFDRCERIPLRKSPLFSSHNKTIDFVRDKATSQGQGHFELYRLRFNTKYIERDEQGNVVVEERVAADFIDVSIASKDDAELIDFWQRGRCLNIFDRFSGVWITTPDIHTCISDLHKMLFVYECPEGKKPKRTQKYNILKSLLNTPYA